MANAWLLLRKLMSLAPQLLQFLELQQTQLPWGSPKRSFLRYLICVYSGTVGGAREAFFHGIPSVAVSYDCYNMVGRKLNVDDFTLCAEASIPIITAMLAEIKNKTYPQNCFLNINVPREVANNKGYRLTKQGKCFYKMGWTQVTSEAQEGTTSPTKVMEIKPPENTEVCTEESALSTHEEYLVFKLDTAETPAVDNDDTDYSSLQAGYITVIPSPPYLQQR